MKKLVYTAIIALGTLGVVNAQETETQTKGEIALNTEVAVDTQIQDKFVSIENADVPVAIQKAMATDFEGATLTKAFVNSKNEFKLMIVTAADAEKTVYATEKGEWIEK